MYLISSTKLRKAKNELTRTKPYFTALKAEIKRIFRTAPDVESKYFYPEDRTQKLDGTYGCLVITGDKGLAGAYNHNIIKDTMHMLEEHPDTRLFVVGEFGRQAFMQRGIKIEQSFLYPAQNPTMQRAREISSILLRRFESGELVKIFVVYTDMKNGLSSAAEETRILPFHRSNFTAGPTDAGSKVSFEFTPSVSAVLDNIIESYVSGFIYSALVDSFTSEQNSRMEAMNAANENADSMLSQLSVQYNRVRQAAITQEITEVTSGARALKKSKLREAE